jgi:hypothetical protein
MSEQSPFSSHVESFEVYQAIGAMPPDDEYAIVASGATFAEP